MGYWSNILTDVYNQTSFADLSLEGTNNIFVPFIFCCLFVFIFSQPLRRKKAGGCKANSENKLGQICMTWMHAFINNFWKWIYTNSSVCTKIWYQTVCRITDHGLFCLIVMRWCIEKRTVHGLECLELKNVTGSWSSGFAIRIYSYLLRGYELRKGWNIRWR